MKVTKVGHFSGHKNSIYVIHPSLKKDAFYSGASDGFVVEWNHPSADGELLVNVQKPVYSLLTIPEKNELLIGTASGNLHVIDLATKQETKNIQAHVGGIFDIQRQQSTIFTTGEDGCIHVWDVNTLQPLKTIKASDKSARVLAIAPLRNEFAVGFSDHKVRIYNAQTYELKKVLNDHVNSVFSLAYNKTETVLVSGGRDAKLHVRSCLNDFELIHDIPAHNYHINSIQFNPSSTFIATGSMDKSIKIWDAKTFELLKVIDRTKIESHLSSINKVYWLTDAHLLSCSDDKQIMMWEIELTN